MPFQLRCSGLGSQVEGLTMQFYNVPIEKCLHMAPIGIGHNMIVLVLGPTPGLASVGIIDESGNLMDWLMEDEPLEEAMAYAKKNSKPDDWDTDNQVEFPCQE